MSFTPENILLIGSLLLFLSIIASKTSYKVGVPTLILFLIIGMILGVAVGYVAGKVTHRMLNKIKLDTEGLYPVLVLSIVFFTFSFTEWINGNGFLAVYISGLMLG